MKILASIVLFSLLTLLNRCDQTVSTAQAVKPSGEMDTFEGAWDPWVQNAEGGWVWNPSKGYNAWVDTLSVDECAWLAQVDAKEELYSFRPEPEPDSLGEFPWEVDDWEEVEQWIRRPTIQSALQKYHKFSRRLHMGCYLQTHSGPEIYEAYKLYNPDGNWVWEPSENLPENPPESDWAQPYIAPARVFAKYQIASVFIERSDGDSDAVVVGLASVLGYLSFLDDQSAIAQLVYFSNVKEASLALLSILEETPGFLSGAQLQELDRMYEGILDSGVLLFEIDAERLKFADIVRRCLNKRGKLDPKRAAKFLDSAANYGSFDVKDPSPVSLEFSKLDPGAQSVLELSTDVLRIMHEESKIPWTGIDALESINSTGDTLVSGILETNFIEIMIPGYRSVASVSRETQQRVIATRLVIAIHRHKLRHGAFPKSIEQVDADLLGFEPIDAFSGKMLGYEVFEGKVQIYSIGADLDDDGGVGILGFDDQPEWLPKEEVERLNAEDPWILDGDWVLFPVIRY